MTARIGQPGRHGDRGRARALRRGARAARVTIKLTPRGKVPMMELIEALRTNPMAALARFQVDASIGR